MTQNKQAKVRVLALAAEAYGGRGGIAQSTRDLILALSNMPEIASVDILPRLQPENTTNLPDGVWQFPAISSRLAYVLKAIWLAVKLRPQIVYCGHAFMAPLAWTTARLSGAQLVCHVHGLEVWKPLSALQQRSLSSSDLILCVSQYTAKKLVEVTGADPKLCEVIYNTVDERFVPGDRWAARERFNISSDAIVLSTVSRLDPRQQHKGHDRVIVLLKDLAEKHPKLLYLVAGTGGDHKRLEALARANGIADNVKFLGFVSDGDLPDLYRASDLYVMPSHGEGFGIAFVEAMACGTPALGLDLGGAGEALRDGELGRAVSEMAFPDVLRDDIATPRPDDADLSARCRYTFGRPAFAARLKQAIVPLIA